MGGELRHGLVDLGGEKDGVDGELYHGLVDLGREKGGELRLALLTWAGRMTAREESFGMASSREMGGASGELRLASSIWPGRRVARAENSDSAFLNLGAKRAAAGEDGYACVGHER